MIMRAVYQDVRKIIWKIQWIFQFFYFSNSAPASSEARQILNVFFLHLRARARITIYRYIIMERGRYRHNVVLSDPTSYYIINYIINRAGIVMH